MPVYGGQWFDIGQKHVFIDLVNAFRYRTEFDDLRTDAGDKAAIRCTTGRGQFGNDTGFVHDGAGKGIEKGALWRQKRHAGTVPVKPVIEVILVQNGVHPFFQVFHGACRTEAEIEFDGKFTRDDIVGTCSGVDVGNLPGSRFVVFIAVVPDFGGQFG